MTVARKRLVGRLRREIEKEPALWGAMLEALTTEADSLRGANDPDLGFQRFRAGPSRPAPKRGRPRVLSPEQGCRCNRLFPRVDRTAQEVFAASRARRNPGHRALLIQERFAKLVEMLKRPSAVSKHLRMPNHELFADLPPRLPDQLVWRLFRSPPALRNAVLATWCGCTERALDRYLRSEGPGLRLKAAILAIRGVTRVSLSGHGTGTRCEEVTVTGKPTPEVRTQLQRLGVSAVYVGTGRTRRRIELAD